MDDDLPPFHFRLIGRQAFVQLQGFTRLDWTFGQI